METVFLFGQKSPDRWQPEGFEAFWCKHIQCLTRRRSVLNFIRFCCLLPHNLARIHRLIRSHGITIVHVDGVTNFVPALAARWAGVSIVWHYNDHLPGPARRVLVPLMTRLSSRVIVQGEGLKDSRTAGNPRLRNKTCVLYSAVDTAKLVPEAYDAAERARVRAELGIPADCTLVGAVGNLNRFKGYTYFLEAAARIKRQTDRVRFVVVGRKLETDVGYWDHLQQLTSQLGLSESVLFAGFRDDIPRVLAALDVYVLSSVLESCPVALLEAMAMQVPVVATDVGAVREIIDHGRTGFVVPPEDSEALARGVLSYLALSRPQRDEIVEAARKRVEQAFAIDIIARQQNQLYESVVMDLGISSHP